jgi:hypothetical protein
MSARRFGVTILVTMLMWDLSTAAHSYGLGGFCGAGVPCDCGDELVASRTLVSGVDPITVTPCPGHGLLIESSALTLDLGDNTISATAGRGGIGIILNDVSGTTVTGGTIAGFGIGIQARLANRSRFSALRILGGDAGIVGLGDDNTIERTVFRRLGEAISFTGAGPHILSNRIEDCAFGVWVTINPVDDSGAHGSSVIARNVILRSGGPSPIGGGLTVFGDAVVIDHNQVTRSSGHGLVLSGTGHRITRNVAHGNGGHGFSSRGLSGSTFDGNRAQANELFGMEDDSVGDGTSGTANTYTIHNLCTANDLGDSAPPRLCF